MALGPTRLNLRCSNVRKQQWAKLIARIHGGILQHIGDNEKTDHAPSDVDLIKLGDTAIPSGNRDIFQRDVEIVLGCNK